MRKMFKRREWRNCSTVKHVICAQRPRYVRRLRASCTAFRPCPFTAHPSRSNTGTSIAAALVGGGGVMSRRPRLAATYATQLRSTNKPPHLGAIRSVLRFAVETDRTHSRRRRPDVFVSKGKVSFTPGSTGPVSPSISSASRIRTCLPFLLTIPVSPVPPTAIFTSPISPPVSPVSFPHISIDSWSYLPPVIHFPFSYVTTKD
jgi:hypothetical protein